MWTLLDFTDQNRKGHKSDKRQHLVNEESYYNDFLLRSSAWHKMFFDKISGPCNVTVAIYRFTYRPVKLNYGKKYRSKLFLHEILLLCSNFGVSLKQIKQVELEIWVGQ